MIATAMDSAAPAPAARLWWIPCAVAPAAAFPFGWDPASVAVGAAAAVAAACGTRALLTGAVGPSWERFALRFGALLSLHAAGFLGLAVLAAATPLQGAAMFAPYVVAVLGTTVWVAAAMRDGARPEGVARAGGVDVR